MVQTALITGNSSGLGLGLTEALLNAGWVVYGLSRRGCPLRHPNLHDHCCDLSRLAEIEQALIRLLHGAERLDLVMLNAGVLGEIRDLHETSLESVHEIMDINVWSNKRLLDILIKQRREPAQVVLISSGAAIRGRRGWGAYALSKATLNMLAQLYSEEMPDTHLCALSPGMVDTAMQDYLCDPERVDAEQYPSVNAARAAKRSASMPDPTEIARQIVELLPVIASQPSGVFLHSGRDFNRLRAQALFRRLWSRLHGVPVETRPGRFWSLGSRRRER